MPQLATSRRWWSMYPVMLLKTPIRREGCGLETTKRELLYFVRSEWTQPGQALLWASFPTPTKPQGAVSTPAQPLGGTEAGPLRITEKGFPWPWRQIGRSLRDLPSQRKQVFASSWHQGRQEVVGALVGPRAGSRPSPCPSLAVPSGCWFPADAKDAHRRAHMGLPVWYLAGGRWGRGRAPVTSPPGPAPARLAVPDWLGSHHLPGHRPHQHLLPTEGDQGHGALRRRHGHPQPAAQAVLLLPGLPHVPGARGRAPAPRR